jgi:hypothetical protein
MRAGDWLFGLAAAALDCVGSVCWVSVLGQPTRWEARCPQPIAERPTPRKAV